MRAPTFLSCGIKALVYELSAVVNQTEMHLEFTEIMVVEIAHFLSMDILFNTSYIDLRIYIMKFRNVC